VLGRYSEMVNDKDPRDSACNPRYVTKANFNFGYQPIDGNYPTAAPGVYTVGAGDTLQSIARSAYGDAGLWYRIADAKGLSDNSGLRVGQALTIPNRVPQGLHGTRIKSPCCWAGAKAVWAELV
jgi:nucleoid-associated protein YgaU